MVRLGFARRGIAAAAVLMSASGLIPAAATHNACHDEGFGDDVFVDTGVAFAGADTGLNDGWMRACLDVLGQDVTASFRQNGSQQHAYLISCHVVLPFPAVGGPATCGAGPFPTDRLAVGTGAGLDDSGDPFQIQAIPPPAGASATTVSISFFNESCMGLPLPLVGFETGTINLSGLEARRIPGGVTSATLTTPFTAQRVGAHGVVITGTTSVAFANGGGATGSVGLGAGVVQYISNAPPPSCGAPQLYPIHVVSVIAPN